MADPVKGLTSNVGLDVLTSGLHEDTDKDEDDHVDITFAAPADVDDLGNGQLTGPGSNAADDADDRQQTVLAKRRGDVGFETRGNRLKESIDEDDQIQAGSLSASECCRFF